MQTIAVWATVFFVAVVAGCFGWVLMNTKGEAALERIAPKAYAFRTWLLVVVLVAGAILAYQTLKPWPHEGIEKTTLKRFHINSMQWAWELDETQVIAGDEVEFLVTAKDVNHGFGLYSPTGQLVAQVQAMPGFENKMRYRFITPGTYQILCMEYCGLAHHRMVTSIEVASAATVVPQ
ncbi:MAG TPA: hypothetical protein PLQ67_09820 [Burkholderiaceae bacterium]|nr:hypothetical protein [Burkholderiaceae bacterium]